MTSTRTGAGWRLCVRIAILGSLAAGTATAQSTSARLAGTVYDQQKARLPGAIVTLKNLETGQIRTSVSNSGGDFHLPGLPPGPYEMSVGLSGFTTHIRSDIQLGLSEEAYVSVTLQLAPLTEALTVVGADLSPVEIAKSSLGQTITTEQLDDLPVPDRDFVALALLAPGMATNRSTASGGSGVATAGQNGRNNTFLLDGLTLDDTETSSRRGGVPLDTIKEFTVMTNGFAAEHGQASGAVISVLSRSGTNRFANRGFYYHRDDAWDATPGAARLATPPIAKSKLEQKVVGGYSGGPIVRNRAFFFGSGDETVRGGEILVTSPVLHLFRPQAPAAVPQRFQRSQAFGRIDATFGKSNTFATRYRIDRSATPRVTNADRGLAAPERTYEDARRARDLAASHNAIVGSSALNEFKFQFAHWYFGLDPTSYCDGCFAENRPSIRLGKSPSVPNRRTERRWQFTDTLSYFLPDRLGDHLVKAGLDVSAIGADFDQLPNRDGTFVFDHDAVFDPADAATYPRQYTRTDGNPLVHLDHELYSAFLQDQWRPRPNLTLNLGVRWDYDNEIGISQDTDNVAPRIGVTFDPRGTGRSAIRANYGIYYDGVFLLIAREAEQAKTAVLTRITYPGYPDPRGPNPRHASLTVTPRPNITRLAEDVRTPYTEQITIGGQHTLTGRLALAIDYVRARGHNLLRTRDVNYPDLDLPNRPRPDPNFGLIEVVETGGSSWYDGLQVSVQKRHAKGHSYTVAYTLSTAERDTEDSGFVPQDHRYPAAERGPSLNDSRHRLSASVSVDLPFRMRLSSVVAARSGSPYNVTTGHDDNGDTYFTDRPSGVGRNSAREADYWHADVRLSKTFRSRARRIELLAEAFNVTNRRNWTSYIGNLSSQQFGRPLSASSPREVQAGIRVSF